MTSLRSQYISTNASLKYWRFEMTFIYLTLIMAPCSWSAPLHNNSAFSTYNHPLTNVWWWLVSWIMSFMIPFSSLEVITFFPRDACRTLMSILNNPIPIFQQSKPTWRYSSIDTLHRHSMSSHTCIALFKTLDRFTQPQRKFNNGNIRMCSTGPFTTVTVEL